MKSKKTLIVTDVDTEHGVITVGVARDDYGHGPHPISPEGLDVSSQGTDLLRQTVRELMEQGTIESIERVDRADLHEYVVSCSNGYVWTISNRNVPSPYGTGELRIREISHSGDIVFGFGGVGYLMAVTGPQGNGWVAGGHGGVGNMAALAVHPPLPPGGMTTESEIAARFAVVGYYVPAGDPIVLLEYNIHFDGHTYMEAIKATALADFSIAFAYNAVNTGAGACAITGGFSSVNGVPGFGCANQSQYHIFPPSQTMILEGSAHRSTVATTAPGIIETLVRDRDDSTLKAYAKSGPENKLQNDTWEVTNTYTMEYLGE